MSTKSEKLETQEFKKLLEDSKYQELGKVMLDNGVGEAFKPGTKKVELISAAIEAYEAIGIEVVTQEEAEVLVATEEAVIEDESIVDEEALEEDDETFVGTTPTPEVAIGSSEAPAPADKEEKEVLLNNIKTLRMNLFQATDTQKVIIHDKISKLEARLK